MKAKRLVALRRTGRQPRGECRFRVLTSVRETLRLFREAVSAKLADIMLSPVLVLSLKCAQRYVEDFSGFQRPSHGIVIPPAVRISLAGR